MLPDQALTRLGDVVSECDVGAADLLVCLEGDVPGDHVVEEDAQAPHRGLGPQVAGAAHPLWRRVDPGALELGVVVPLHLEEGPAAEVYELELAGLQVDEDVLVLDVAVDDAGGVAGQHRLHHLPEEVGRHLLVQAALLTDVVEHVYAVTRVLQNINKGVISFEEVQNSHNSVHFPHCAKQLQLKRNFLSIQLKIFPCKYFFQITKYF